MPVRASSCYHRLRAGKHEEVSLALLSLCGRWCSHQSPLTPAANPSEPRIQSPPPAICWRGTRVAPSLLAQNILASFNSDPSTWWDEAVGERGGTLLKYSEVDTRRWWCNTTFFQLRGTDCKFSRTLRLQCRAAICVRPFSNTLSSSQGKKTPRSLKHPTSNVSGYKVELYISLGFLLLVVRATQRTTRKPFNADSVKQASVGLR